jgi:thioredoxin-related protein
MFKKLLGSIILSFFVISLSLADYSEDYKEAKDPNKVWLIIIGDNNCNECRRFVQKVAQIKKENPNLVVSKLHHKSKKAQELMKRYSDGNLPEVKTLPDYIAYKYSDGKFTYFFRAWGDRSKEDLIKMLKLNKKTPDSPYYDKPDNPYIPNRPPG